MYDQIGNSIDKDGNVKYGISGSSFAYEMQYLQNNCSQINIRINSIGGNVLDGYSIVSSILTSSVPCDTYIDGLAASIAGVVAVAGKKCRMMDYGTLMMHNASGSDDKAMLELVNGTICTILSNRTSKTPAEIATMMEKETWMTADEALNMGIVDEVVKTEKKIRVKKESLQNMAFIYNQLITNTHTMDKVLNILSVKNEDEAIVSIEALQAENKNLKKQVSDFEAKELVAKEKEATELKNKATKFVDQLVVDKKITEAEKAATLENAIQNYDFVVNVFSKVNAVKNATKVFDATKIENKSSSAEDRSSWTIRDWEKKDPAGLMEIKNTDENAYQTMFNAFYKTK